MARDLEDTSNLVDSRHNALLLSALTTAALALLQAPGCSATAPRQIEYDTSNEASAVTEDGLLRVRTMRGGAYVRPGTSLSGYRRLLIGPSTATFRAADHLKVNKWPSDVARSSEITARISQLLRESLEQEFRQSDRFSVVTERGADVLWISGHVADLDIDFTPPPGGERQEGGPEGELTFILDVRDSETREARLLLLDRLKLGRKVGSPATTWPVMTQSISGWAHRVRKALEWIADVETPPAPPRSAGNP